MNKERILVAMSGGVDSSVAALLLQQQGYDVVGITFQLYDYSRQNRKEGKGGCCSLEDVTDARAVCIKLGIKHYLFDSRERFKERVVDYFSNAYRQGRTPNPCVACNTFIKFDELLHYADLVGATQVATGHYAQMARRGDQFLIQRAVDPQKDQSYFLLGVTQDKLRRTLFPCGGFSKAEIRAFAEQAGLPVSQKPDSQEVCFIPENNYRKFLKEEAGLADHEGQIVDEGGRVLAQHQGIHHFTVGQKKGLGDLGLHHYYVIRLDAQTRQVIVGSDQSLNSDGLEFEIMNGELFYDPTIPLFVKIRSRASLVEAELVSQDSKSVTIKFKEPQRAVTPGQFAVLYQNDCVVGGGPILKPLLMLLRKAIA